MSGVGLLRFQCVVGPGVDAIRMFSGWQTSVGRTLNNPGFRALHSECVAQIHWAIGARVAVADLFLSEERMQNSAISARKIRERIASHMGPQRYDVWFRDAEVRVEKEERRIAIKTGSPFVAKWIGQELSQTLDGIARETFGESGVVAVEVEARGARGRDHQQQSAPSDPPNSRRTHAKTPERSRRASGNSKDSAPSETQSAMRSLRTLDEFFVGPCNRLAQTAGQRLIDEPAQAGVSPLFIHGSCGVGKTHLLQGISHQFLERHGRRAKLRYLTGEQFTNEYIASIRHQNIEAFRKKYRGLDLLVIDDVHFLRNKMRTQSELMCTLDALELNGGKVVFSSDVHPKLIEKFSQQLISRMLSGMVVQMDLPDRMTRLEIIKAFALERQLELSSGAVDLISQRFLGSVREIQGVITKLAALVSLQPPETASLFDHESFHFGVGKRKVGVVMVEQILEDEARHCTSPIRISDIIHVVCERLQVPKSELMGRGRHRKVVLARSLVAYLGRDLTTMSYPELARAIGRDYHSTVHTAERRLKKQLLRDEAVLVDEHGPAIPISELLHQLRHDADRQNLMSVAS